MARGNGRTRDKHRRSVDEPTAEPTPAVEQELPPARAPSSGRAFYCNLYLDSREADMLESMRQRVTTEWEALKDEQLERPELVRRILIYAVKTYQARNEQSRAQFVQDHMEGGLL